MSDIQILIAVISVLWIISGALFGVIVNIYSTKIKTLEVAKEEYGKRISRIEDVQVSKLDELKADFKEFRIHVDTEMNGLKDDIKTLANNIHSQKNSENAMRTATDALLKTIRYLDRHEAKG